MLGFLNSLLGFTARDRGRLFSMAGLLFVLMAGLAIGRAASDSFFIKTAGSENIPYMYLFNALSMVLLSALYARIEKLISRYRLFLYLVASLIGILAALRAGMLWIPEGLLAYGLYAFYEVSLLLLLMHFWTFANDILDPREGKRLFPLIGGAGLVGLIFGGFLTSFLAERLGTANLFLLWLGFLGLSLPGIYLVKWSANKAGVAIENLPGIIEEGGNTWSNIEDLLSIPLVRTLAWINLPLWLVVHTVDYLFLVAMDEMFPHADMLAAFLGSLNALISLTGILIQIMLARLLLQKLGVARTYAIYSISMTLAAASLFVRGFFPSKALSVLSPRNLLAVTARFLDEGILNSVYDSAQQLLFNALPSKVRGQARALISGAVEPAVTAFAGILLLFLGALQLSSQFIAGLASLLGLVWIYMSLRVHGQYTESLIHNIDARDPEQMARISRQLSSKLSVAASERLLKELKSPDPEVGLIALEYLKEAIFEKKMYKILQALRHVPKETGIAILDYFGESKFRYAGPQILPFIHHPDPAIQAAVIRYMSRLGAKEVIKKCSIFFNSPHAEPAGEAIIASLEREEKLRPSLPAYRALVRLAKSNSTEKMLAAARVIRKLHRPELLPLLARLVKSKRREVQIQAIRAMGYVGNEKSIPTLIRCLDDEELYPHAEDSLIRLGGRKLDSLHEALSKRSFTLKSRARLIKCIGEIADPRSVAYLALLLKQEHISLEDAALEALARLKYQLAEQDDRNLEHLFPEGLKATVRRVFSVLNRKLARGGVYLQTLSTCSEHKNAVELLYDAIERAGHRHEEILFACLEILSDARRARTAYMSLRTGQRRDIAEAIELIEELGPEGQALAWTLELKYDEEHPFSEELTVDDLLLELITQKQQSWLTACTLYAIGCIQPALLLGLVPSFAQDNDNFIKQNALVALYMSGQKLPKGVTVREVRKMASTMERILFLRSVPIFAGIDGADLHWINEITQQVEIKSGQTIFREGDTGDAMYIIVEGRIKVLKGNDTVLDILEERDCFGEMAILDQEPRSASARTDTHTRLLAIERDDFQRLLLARPQISIAMFKNISLRLRDLTRRMSQAETAISQSFG